MVYCCVILHVTWQWYILGVTQNMNLDTSYLALMQLCIVSVLERNYHNIRKFNYILLDWLWQQKLSTVKSTAECHYKVVPLSQYYIQHWNDSIRTLIRLKIHKRQPISCLHWASYGMSLVRIWEKMDCVIMASHCIMLCTWYSFMKHLRSISHEMIIHSM